MAGKGSLIVGVPVQHSYSQRLANSFTICTILRLMKSNREIEILFRRLRLYDRLERRAEGLVRAIQRVMGERYGSGSRSLRNRAHARPGRKNSARPEQVMALQWYDEKADNPPWIDALAELRQRATR